MTLRLRLLLGYGYLVGLLLVATGSAVLGFLHLSVGIDRVLGENYRSIQLSMTMLESLERQDSETLSGLLTGARRTGELERFEQEFTGALEGARANITESMESDALDQIRDAWARYDAARDALLVADAERPLAAYQREVVPLFLDVKRGVRGLLELNQEAMVQAERDARSSALRSGAWLGFLVVVALLSLVVLSRAMQRDLLIRLERLHREVVRIARGDEQRRLRDEADDEIGAVSRGVNELLDRQVQQRGAVQALLAQERRLLVGVLATCHADAALYDLGGRRRAGREDVPEEVTEWLREDGRRAIEDETADEPPTIAGWRLRLLMVEAGYPAGWLAEPAEGAADGSS